MNELESSTWIPIHMVQGITRTHTSVRRSRVLDSRISYGSEILHGDTKDRSELLLLLLAEGLAIL